MSRKPNPSRPYSGDGECETLNPELSRNPIPALLAQSTHRREALSQVHAESSPPCHVPIACLAFRIRVGCLLRKGCGQARCDGLPAPPEPLRRYPLSSPISQAIEVDWQLSKASPPVILGTINLMRTIVCSESIEFYKTALVNSIARLIP